MSVRVEHGTDSRRRRSRSLTRAPRLLITGYFVVLAVVAASATPALAQTIHTLDHQQSVYDPVSEAVSNLLVAGLNQEDGVRGYALTADPSFLEPYRLGTAGYGQASAVLRHAIVDDAFARQVAATTTAFGRWHRWAGQVIATVSSGKVALARSAPVQQTGKDDFDAFRSEDDALAATVRTAVASSRQELRHEVVLSLVALIAALVLGVVVGSGMVLWWRVWGRRSAVSEQRLGDSALLLQSAIDATSDGIFAKDLSGRHILANKARVAALTGGDAEADIIGHTVDDYVDVATAAQVKENEAAVVRTGEPRRLEEHLPQPDGPHTYVVTKNPLRDASGTLSGVVGVARDVTWELALLADRDRLYRLEHQLAQTLQLALLGNDRLDGERVRACARYLPALDDMAVGGDWYDIISLPGDRVALIVGDAVGHGLISATAMGQLRSALGALTRSSPDPARALEALDEFAQAVPSAHSATCVVAVLDARAEQLSYSSAGQTPPVVLTGADPVVLGEHQDPPLTAPRAQPRRTTTVPFASGSTVLLCTDGLVERRGRSIDVGLRRLADAVRRHGALELDALCDAVVAEMLGDEDHLDDVALVAARLGGRR